MTKPIFQFDNKIPMVWFFGAIASAIIFGITTNAKVEDNTKSIARIEANDAMRMQRGAAAISELNSVKVEQAVTKMRVDKLEEAIIDMKDNVQKIADKILK